MENLTLTLQMKGKELCKTTNVIDIFVQWMEE